MSKDERMLARNSLGISMAAALSLLICSCSRESSKGYEATEAPNSIESNDVFPFSFDPPRLAQTGPESCAQCHAKEYTDWKVSHHAKANRPISVELDAAAFTPTREITESGVTYRMEKIDDAFWLRVINKSGEETSYELVGVIGETPIRQYLTRLEGDKFQTISASYAVLENKWIDVFAGQDRMPGEWGHWLGQGMNWNSNCAYCHTTEYAKAFDFKNDRYESTWIQQGIACAECHTGLEGHLRAARSGGNLKLPTMSKGQIEDNCVRCHSRRDQLTADAFLPGDAYHDHFSLSLPDQPGLYFADGQIRDEVFVHASFQMSRMAHAGVSCMDCHDPHNLEQILPVQNNMLCMRCHDSGAMNAPVIQPVAHSFHAEGSTGNQCVSCHMPKTTYMQVDPRADHGFHSPDPLMTQELGIPNACSNCHTDKPIDWAVKHAENWYGKKLAQSRQRQRALAISAAYSFEPEGLSSLITLLENEDIAAWRATYTGLIGNYVPADEAIEALTQLLKDSSHLVRRRAVSALASTERNVEVAKDALEDSSRSVRIEGTRSLDGLNEPILNERANQEWLNYLRSNSDRPQSLFILANRAAHEKRIPELRTYLDRAINLDRVNPQVYHQSAILLSMAGLNKEARVKLFTGWELAPDSAIFPYSLGLLAAETNELQTAIGYLEEAVALQPNFYRAWYNLSLAYQKGNQPEAAARAMQKAQGQ